MLKGNSVTVGLAQGSPAFGLAVVEVVDLGAGAVEVVVVDSGADVVIGSSVVVDEVGSAGGDTSVTSVPGFAPRDATRCSEAP
jgi:hypothetical protein